MGLFFALISAFSFGFSNAWWKKAMEKDSFSRLVFYRGVLVLMLFGLISFFSRQTGALSFLWTHQHPQVSDWTEAAFACLVCSMGLVFYLLSLRYTQVMVSSALSSLNVFSILFAVFALHEKFRTVYLFSFALAALGVWLIRSEKGKKGWNSGVWYGLLAAVCWGLGYGLLKKPARVLGAMPVSVLLESAVVLVALCWNLLTEKGRQSLRFWPSSSCIRHYFILMICLAGGTLGFSLALQSLDILVLNLTGNLALVAAILFGWYWYAEKPGPAQWAGAASVLLSLVLVQLLA